MSSSPTARADSEHGTGSPPKTHDAYGAVIQRLATRSALFERYRVGDEIGHGGMGRVLRVRDEDLHRDLAMKVLRTQGPEPLHRESPHGSRHVARFLEEAQVTGQLDHPGIVPVHELGLDADGRVYFTMKLVEGRDLQAIFDLVFLEKEGWNETRALGVILKACEAIAYAHKKDVIHRDLKPANVMVGSFGEVYVMDWGLARVLHREDSHDIRIAPQPESDGTSTSFTGVRTDRSEVREAYFG